MISENPGRGILARVVILFLVLAATAWLAVSSRYLLSGIALCLVIYSVYNLYRFSTKAQKEMGEFVESIHYRDFSRYFDLKHSPFELRPFRKGFNAINSTFREIIREKEIQQQYMQKILELVGTGIICYEEEDGGIILLNETLKNLLGIPYLKSIQDLQRRDEGLYENILALRPGKNKVVRISIDQSEMRVFLSCSLFQTEGIRFKLIAFQDVNGVLDENEARAWGKLLSVMTHEIMNSVAPISSLADTLRTRLLESKVATGKEKQGLIDDIGLGIETIRHRSESLMRFAQTYRNINKVTKPDLQKLFVRDLFGRLKLLMQPLVEQKQIVMEFILPDPELSFKADPSLIEQLLINLITNAMNAVKGRPAAKITISASEKSTNKIILKVSDNGAGIPAENLDKIFVPFFSTTNSSGIGLSLCKQIMLLHDGSINVQSTEGKGTAILLLFQ
jgi:nitrogen fixation/metabolism regulation signal transduction histidine kinase